MTFLRAVLALLLMGLTACQTSQVAMNQALPTDSAGAPIYTPGYALMDMLRAPRGEILVALAFSGGGKRWIRGRDRTDRAHAAISAG